MVRFRKKFHNCEGSTDALFEGPLIFGGTSYPLSIWRYVECMCELHRYVCMAHSRNRTARQHTHTHTHTHTYTLTHTHPNSHTADVCVCVDFNCYFGNEPCKHPRTHSHTHRETHTLSPTHTDTHRSETNTHSHPDTHRHTHTGSPSKKRHSRVTNQRIWALFSDIVR